MRKLTILVAVLAVLYGGYWFVGRSQVENGLTFAISEIDAGDVTLTYDTLNTRGFPSRFDTTIETLVFEDPVSATKWEAPWLQIFALAYNPTEVIAVFPPEQSITVNGETFTLFSNDMRASGDVRANAALSFQQAVLTADNPRLRTQDGAEIAMASLRTAMRQSPGEDQSYDLFLDARSIVLPEAIRAAIDPDGTMPPMIRDIRLDGTLGLSDEIALNSDAAPQLDAATIKEFGIDWGDISLSAIGDVVADANGLAEGSITLSARNWEQALDLAVTAGAIAEGVDETYATMASTFNETPQIPDTLTVTLTFADGATRLGSLPIGPAPLLR